MPILLWHNVLMATMTQSAPLLELDLETVEEGVELAALNEFIAKSGLSNADIYEVVLPARTLKHRKARNESLSIDESDRLARLVRVFDHAVKVWTTPERARLWLSSPKKRYEGRTPIQMLRTEIGGRMVDNFLGQIDHGMFA